MKILNKLLTSKYHSFCSPASIYGTGAQMVAGHSLGEFSVLVAKWSFKLLKTDFKLVFRKSFGDARSVCINPSSWRILGLDDASGRNLCVN